MPSGTNAPRRHSAAQAHTRSRRIGEPPQSPVYTARSLMAETEIKPPMPLIPIRVRAVLRRSKLLRNAVVRARHRGLRETDYMVASFPRSGNTWVRFVLADLATGEPVDYQGVDRVSPVVGFHVGAPDLVPGARLVKTHEPYRREYRRGAYFVRDVRDVLISWYRVTRADPDDLSDLDDFVRDFAKGEASPYGDWAAHVKGWLAAAERLPIRVIRFESLRTDPAGTILEIAGDLGLECTRDDVVAALERNSPERMHELEAKNEEYLTKAFGYQSRGVRSGKIGGWRELLTEEHLAALEPVLVTNRELGYD